MTAARAIKPTPSSTRQDAVCLVADAIRDYSVSFEETDEWAYGFVVARHIQGILLRAGFDHRQFHAAQFQASIEMVAERSELDCDELLFLVDTAWDKVRLPEGYSPLSYAIAKVERSGWRPTLRAQFPSGMMQSRAEAFCAVLRELQKESDDAFISCRSAGKILRISPTAAGQMIDRLIAAGDVTVVEAHTTSRARRLCYKD